MVTLNLTARGEQEEKVKKYLEENASEVLAEKINNGVKIVKDDKTLINKKTLKSFMDYACTEASKQAEKGARGIYIDDPTVYGWAIHYFEEDSIEGILFNEDGTEHKPAPAYTPPKTIAKPTTPPPPPAPKNMTLFDLMDAPPDPKPTIQEKLKQEIETRYPHPERNIIVSGMPPIEQETPKVEQDTEVDIYNLDDF